MIFEQKKRIRPCTERLDGCSFNVEFMRFESMLCSFNASLHRRCDGVDAPPQKGASMRGVVTFTGRSKSTILLFLLNQHAITNPFETTIELQQLKFLIP